VEITGFPLMYSGHDFSSTAVALGVMRTSLDMPKFYTGGCASVPR
jgi:hypothetical protein